MMPGTDVGTVGRAVKGWVIDFVESTLANIGAPTGGNSGLGDAIASTNQSQTKAAVGERVKISTGTGLCTKSCIDLIMR